MSESTAVATSGASGTGVAMTAEAKAAFEELETIRNAGAVAIERKKVLNTLHRVVQGLTWGDVSAASMSGQTQYAIAELCHVTGANPVLHLDILGGKPYLNAKFYGDLANQHPLYIGYEQRSLLPAMSAQLRVGGDEAEKEGRQLLRDSEELGMPELRERARTLLLEASEARGRARDIDERRVHYGIPEEAPAAYETFVDRYTTDAPIESIRAGEIDDQRFVRRVSEASWIDTRRNDPVGKKEPDKTCRTRSLRRALEKAFSAYMEPKMREVEKFERQIEAEWREIRSDQAETRAQLPASSGAQAVNGHGEPSARRADDAGPLPVREVGDGLRPAADAASDSAAGRFAEQTQQGIESLALDDLRKRYFAQFREVGAERKAFQATLAMPDGSQLPDSTTQWGAQHYECALAAIDVRHVQPALRQFRDGAGILGDDPEDLAQAQFGKSVGELYLKEILALVADVGARIDADTASEPSGQARML